jgi:Flp pilus assembly protein TadG
MRDLKPGRARRPRTRREGQALVEFVLILPLLLIMVFGLIDFARAWSAHQAIADAAREGTRMVVVADADVGINEARQRVENRLSGAGLNASVAAITFWRNGAQWDGLTQNRGDTIAVRIEYPYDFWIVGPFLGWATGNRTVYLTSFINMRGE